MGRNPGVWHISVDGERGSATVSAVVGSGLGRAEMRLAKEEGSWKIIWSVE